MVGPRDSGNTTGWAFGRGAWTLPQMPSGRSSANVMAQILGIQCFLARTALGWNVSQLGRAAGVSYHTIQDFERGGSPRPSTVEAIQRALEKAGVIFIDANDGGPGARLGR
jgi:DNA-binding XRE family transcriptional regulator